MSRLFRLLIIDNDALLISLLEEQFKLHGEFQYSHATDSAAARELCAAHLFDLILVSADMPDAAGFTFCRESRAQDMCIPLIMLGASTQEAEMHEFAVRDMINAYMIKPFRFGALLASIRTQLRAHEKSEAADYKIGPYRFVHAQRLLLHDDGSKIRLTEKEAHIISYLHRAGDAVGREQLLHEVWGYNASVTTHTLETHIYRLRRKIEADPTKAEILITAPEGYRLII